MQKVWSWYCWMFQQFLRIQTDRRNLQHFRTYFHMTFFLCFCIRNQLPNIFEVFQKQPIYGYGIKLLRYAKLTMRFIILSTPVLGQFFFKRHILSGSKNEAQMDWMLTWWIVCVQNNRYEIKVNLTYKYTFIAYRSKRRFGVFNKESSL